MYLLSDNGRQFTAKLFQEVCTKLGIRNLFTTTNNPQTNGQVERFNRTILAGLRRFASEDRKHWDVFLNAVTLAYNTQVHSSTGCSPCKLVLSRPPGPLAMQVIALSTVAGELPQQVRRRVIERISDLVAKARKSLSVSQARYKRNFDARVNPAAPLVPGRPVYLRQERKAEDKLLPSHRLKPKVSGSFEVIRTNSHTVAIDRDKLLDKISKDRVVLAPIKQGVLQPVLVEDEAQEERRGALVPPRPRAMIGQECGYPASKQRARPVTGAIPSPQHVARDLQADQELERSLVQLYDDYRPAVKSEVLSEEVGETWSEEGEVVSDRTSRSETRDAGNGSLEEQVVTRSEEVGDQIGESSDDEEEYDIERLVAYHPDFGFRVRLSGFTAEADAWGKAETLSFSARASYFGRMSKPIPREIQRLQSVPARARR